VGNYGPMAGKEVGPDWYKGIGEWRNWIIGLCISE
jgi:hypothetical protein